VFSHNLLTNKVYPDLRLGKFAYNNLSKNLYSGQVGAGASASKGQGVEFQTKMGFKILCIIVNNSMGNVYSIEEGKQLTDTNPKDIEFGHQTTVTTVVTDMILDLNELKQMSHQVHASIAQIIRPFNTFMDGDIFYACSTQKKSKPRNWDMFMLSEFFSEITDVVHDAIIKSI